jgi:hypothetical protein
MHPCSRIGKYRVVVHCLGSLLLDRSDQQCPKNTHLEIAEILFSDLNLFAHPHQLPGRKCLTAGAAAAAAMSGQQAQQQGV